MITEVFEIIALVLFAMVIGFIVTVATSPGAALFAAAPFALLAFVFSINILSRYV